MRVQELFEAEKLTKEDLSSIEDESDYWASASQFVLAKWEEPLDDLTQKQANWVSKICEDMTERRIKGRL